MAIDASLLLELPLFASLDASERELLAAAVTSQQLAAEEQLFTEGDQGRAMYVVVSGQVELSVRDRAGQKIVLTECRRGDVFGELAMLDSGPRTATAQALEASELLSLDRGALLALVTRRPEAALHLLGAMGAMTRKADLLLRTRVVRNPHQEMEDARTSLERLTDWIADFSGSIPFLVLSLLWFVVWIGGHALSLLHFDPYPFGLLTMVVSLEAIFLSIILLLAQNRHAAKDRIRDDIEYDINVKAELEVAHLHEKVEAIHEQLHQRMDRLEKLIQGRESRD